MQYGVSKACDNSKQSRAGHPSAECSADSAIGCAIISGFGLPHWPISERQIYRPFWFANWVVCDR